MFSPFRLSSFPSRSYLHYPSHLVVPRRSIGGFLSPDGIAEYFGSISRCPWPGGETRRAVILARLNSISLCSRFCGRLEPKRPPGTFIVTAQGSFENDENGTLHRLTTVKVQRLRTVQLMRASNLHRPTWIARRKIFKSSLHRLTEGSYLRQVYLRKWFVMEYFTT